MWINLRNAFVVGAVASVLGLACEYWLHVDVEPKIEMASSSQVVSEGATGPVEFPLKNTGSKRLILREVKSSCPCVDGEPAEYVVPAGASIILQVLPERDMNAEGMAESVYETNDPARPVLRLTIRREHPANTQAGASPSI